MKGLFLTIAIGLGAGALLLPHDSNGGGSARLETLRHPDAVRSFVFDSTPPMFRRWSSGLETRLQVAER